MSVKVLDIELTEEVAPLKFENEFRKLYVLVRVHKKPLGWLWISEDSGIKPDKQYLIDAVRRNFAGQLVREFIASNEKSADTISQRPISVVVCTRNRTVQLAKCVDSLQKLEYNNFEIIIVDNAPADNSTKELVAKFPVRYIREDIPGLDSARNRGIKEATNDIVAFTDDDAAPDKFWLQKINENFQDEEVMCVSGFVAPAELLTEAQKIFEFGYGGMTHGFIRRTFKKEYLSTKELLWASSFGIGANMAFRKDVFISAGVFDPALDVGTPSCGAGDVEMFHRLVNKGHAIVYDPSVIVWHTHRHDMAGLKKQILYNGRSFGCYVFTCVRNRSVSWNKALKFLMVDWLLKWNLRNVLRRRAKFPRSLALAELKGMLTSPIAYRASQKFKREMHESVLNKVDVRLNKLSNI